jgi:signal transduction histidine kinase/CheY-like chemotaxis protein
VDNALDSTTERLAILARLWGSRALTDQEIYAEAKETLRANADWRNILAFRADGSAVFGDDQPLGTPLPPNPMFDVWRPVVEGRTPVVSDVLVTPPQATPAIFVGVPVVRGGAVSHVLVASLNLTWYDRLLARQGLVEGGVSGLFDRNFRFVARSVEGDERRGTRPTEELIADMKQQREGVGRYTNLNRTSVYTTWTFTRHGWGVGLATPTALIDNPLRDHLILFGALWAVAVGVGLFYAFSKARLITASLESLEGQAQHVADGRRIADLPLSSVLEIDRALGALERASVLLQTTTQERDRSLETEREARAAAETANRAKDEFLAMLSHELRNPLAAISSAGSIVSLEGAGPEQLAFAGGVIARQTKHLKRLIDDLLDVGRAISGKISLERAPLDVGASVRAVAATLQASDRLADRRLELETAPVWIEGDHTRIEQIVTNVLVNAATYTEWGGRIHVGVSGEDGQAVVRVRDDGRGIAAENVPRVFDLFFQADATVDRTGGGLGIGLTLVQRLVRLHGGDVTATSDGRGRGATFTIRLPAIDPPPPAAPPSGRAGRAEPRTVLVVEDNADARHSLCAALELRGHRVLQAADGAAALGLRGLEDIQIAVLDIGLPGMDGYDLARRLRDALSPDVALIALTGYGAARDVQRATQAGFDHHLIKPVDIPGITSLIETVSSASGAGPDEPRAAAPRRE